MGNKHWGIFSSLSALGSWALTRARGDSPSRIPASVPGINGYEKMSVFFKRKWFLRTLLPDSPKETYSWSLEVATHREALTASNGEAQKELHTGNLNQHWFSLCPFKPDLDRVVRGTPGTELLPPNWFWFYFHCSSVIMKASRNYWNTTRSISLLKYPYDLLLIH